MQKLTDLLKKSPYLLGVITVALTFVSVGCQPSANYRGQDLTRPELAVQVQSDLNDLQVRADSAGALYESEVNKLRAEEASIVAESEVASAEIERKELVAAKVFEVVANTAVTAASGGTVNAGDTLASGIGLAGMLFGIGGVGTAVGQTRRRKVAEGTVVDVVTAIDKVKDPAGVVNFKDEGTKDRLEANMSTESRRAVDYIRA